MKPERPPEARLSGQLLRERYERFVELGDPEEGRRAFEVVVRDNPRWGLAWDLLGRLRESVGDDDGAYEAFRNGMDIALASRRMSRQLKTDLVVKVVEFCHARGWTERAERHLDAMARLAPRHPLLERLRGVESSRAMPALSRHLDRREEAQTRVHAARERFRARDWVAARDLYREAIEIDDRCTNAYIFLARTLGEMGPEDLAEGIGWFEEWLIRRPNWGLGHNLIAQLHLAAGDPERAYAAFERAADLSDSSPTLDLRRKTELRADLIQFSERQGWGDRVAAQRGRLAALDPRHPLLEEPSALGASLEVARAAVRRGRLGEAIARYGEHVMRDPHDRQAHVELAQLYREADRETRAAGIRLFRRIVARMPGWGLGHRLLGELLEAQGEDEAAYAALFEATSLGMQSDRLDDTTRIRNLMTMVDFCNRRGWHARAMIHVGAALAIDPDHPEGNALWRVLERKVG